MHKLDFISNCNLVFIDIEATDSNSKRKIIQFSGVRINLDGTSTELSLMINPEQPLSNHIVNLLKIDDFYLQQQPCFKDVKSKIIDFIDDAVIVTFGDFDIKIIKEYLEELDLMFFDFQHYLKQFSKNNVPLLEMHKLVSDYTINNLQHDALYDAIMLKDLFYELIKYDEEDLKLLCMISHIMPRSIIARHKIFSKMDFNQNLWTNVPNINNPPVIVNKLVVGHFIKKNKYEKSTIPYLINLEYEYYDENKKHHKVHWTNHYDVGQYTYDLFAEQAKRCLERFMHISVDKPIFFNNGSKDKINNLIEVIYDTTKKLATLNFINLGYLNKKYKTSQAIKYFYEMLDELPINIQNKFGNFYNSKITKFWCK